MTHDELLKRAKSAVEALFSDKSIAKEETIISLSEIQSDIEMYIMALEEDIEREESMED